MASSNLIKQLQERGLVAQVTDEEALAERLAQGPIALYCGFDPTADSLHLGHLVPLLCLKRFQQAGHKPVALVGGATGLIGDPSFKAAERKLNTEETVQEWVDKIRKQVAPFLDFDCGENSAIAANNYDWFGNMNVLTFLRDIGKHFSVNQMINKEAVKQRLNREDQGISFTEFSYNLLQGYDFACLNKQYGVVLQIGGSDQWGNITSGIDLTRRLHQNQVFGLTVPLIKDEEGKEMILSYLNQGDFIGELGLFEEGQERSAWVRAKTACEVAEISYKKFRQLIQVNPDILMRLSAQMARRLQVTSEKVGNLAFLDVTGRIAQTLLNLAKQPDAMTHPDGMQIKITRQEIGQIVGCSRETVGRILKMLEDQNLISAHGKTIVVYGTR